MCSSGCIRSKLEKLVACVSLDTTTQRTVRLSPPIGVTV